MQSRIKRLVKGKAKKSAFTNNIRQLIKQDKNIISVEELLKSIKVSQKEYNTGKTIQANSIKNLLY